MNDQNRVGQWHARTQVNFADSAGKTIQAFVRTRGHALGYGGFPVLVAFTDDTFAVISIEFGYESCDSEIIDGGFIRQDYPVETMLKLGFVTPDALDAEEREEERKRETRARKKEAAERQLLAELKAKYEGDAQT